MLKNKDNTILKNGDYIYKSQVVDSYIEVNAYYSHSVYLGYSGVTVNEPLKMYLSKLTGIDRYILTTDNPLNYISIGGTYESSYKKFYFFGNLESVNYLRFYTNSSSYRYKGNLIKLLEQFPNLNHIQIGTVSEFNQDISNIKLPKNLNYINLYDNTLSGDINTFENIENVEELNLRYCQFTGNLSEINFNNLKFLDLYQLLSLDCDFNDLIDNNPNLTHLDAYDCRLFSGDSSTLDVSKLEYIYLFVPNNLNFTGSISNWNFNTGLTYFNLYCRYLSGDITNWDFSNTLITSFYLNGAFSSNNNITGDLSDWVLPTTITSLSIQYISGITSIPEQLSGLTNLTSFSVSYCYGLTSISGITTPDSLTSLVCVYCPNVVDNINSINYSNNLSTIQFQGSDFYGDISEFNMPSGLTTLYLFNNSNITGNITGLTLNNYINYISLYGTNIYGSIVNWIMPDSLRTIQLQSTNIYIDFDLGQFNTNNLTQLVLSSISGITGNLSNFIINNNFNYLYLNNTNVNSDLSNFDVSKIYSFEAYNCGDIYGDLTNWLTGTTRLYELQIHTNQYLSGDTSNWNVNGISLLYINNTALSGEIKHNDVYRLDAANTNISSNIRTDFNFSNRADLIELYNTNITGSLSGVTLHSGTYRFYVHDCPNLIGSNDFINYVFEYRKYFTYSTVSFNISNIGDSVTGSTETLGDLGTYTQFSGSSEYYYWNLTENEVNNLVSGLDYDGNGTNVPWDSKQKIYWVKNAKTSSSNLSKRYINYIITY